jgi:hypothetical protein
MPGAQEVVKVLYLQNPGGMTVSLLVQGC